VEAEKAVAGKEKFSKSFMGWAAFRMIHKSGLIVIRIDDRVALTTIAQCSTIIQPLAGFAETLNDHLDHSPSARAPADWDKSTESLTYGEDPGADRTVKAERIRKGRRRLNNLSLAPWSQ
jgi:hypothetical protein